MPRTTWTAWAAVAALSAGVSAGAEDPQWRPTGAHVLVVYASEQPDSRAAAEYYAARRGVPGENLLGVDLRPLGRRRVPSYQEFFDHILSPVHNRLREKQLHRRVCYIVTCPGIPVALDSGHRPPGDEKRRNWLARTSRRSVDQYLISLQANVAAGVVQNAYTDPKTRAENTVPAPGGGAAGPLGAASGEVRLPLFGLYARDEAAPHFRRLRRDRPQRFGFYLVARLGLDLASARDMVDRALYAERHLRLGGDDEPASARPEIWLDMKYAFAADHVASMSRLVPLVRGADGSPFASGEGLRRPWPVVIDTAPQEIGSGSPAHKPTVTARIAAVEGTSITLSPPSQAGRVRDVPGAYYFPAGWKVTRCVPAPKQPGSAPASAPSATAPARPAASAPADPAPSATIVGFDFRNNQLVVDSAEGFAAGDRIQAVWPGEFPTDRCMIFYGFYGLGAFEDVRRFPPGAVGVHVDSSCMRWAQGASGRGITATFGVTAEPLSAGIPYGHLLIPALARGCDWAEAVHNATALAQRWAGVCLGDPLYAPFRSRRRPDKSPPVIGKVAAEAARGTVAFTAELGGRSDDEQADVALFRLEYGPTKAYGKTVEFFDWPEPANGRSVKGRRFGYSRHFRWEIRDLAKGRECHYRLTARDPAGLVDVREGTFVP